VQEPQNQQNLPVLQQVLEMLLLSAHSWHIHKKVLENYMKLIFCYSLSALHMCEDLICKLSALQFPVTEAMHVEVMEACLPQMHSVSRYFPQSVRAI
jgi:hypothetical protein